ncbi:hypothetical protein [uncultured Corynebacterium sp.]|uniref:hypothetical protein n=1 Tax=uncultured Corynebacterium sp. TaxID=159447 RepID=UPI00259182E3|nr:hypothetical protein [uncultured Corynebacterium sp.]
MIELHPYGDEFHQEVDREGRYFSNLRDLAEDNFSEPGEEFTVEVSLIPATNYYGESRAVLVREGISTLGVLPQDALEDWWPTLCALHDANEEAVVNARIWTSRDWDENFYASVRLAMPSKEEAQEAIDEDITEITSENLNAWKRFENFEIEYWDPNWVQAHGWTQDQVKEQQEITQRHLDEYQRKSDPTSSEQSPAKSKRKTKAVKQKKASTPPAERPVVNWDELLTPDGSERATPWQRGYVRSKVNKFYPGSERMPRIDFATVGQCESILRHFDVDPAPLHEAGRGSMALWWVFMVVIGFFFVVMAFVPPGGTVLFLLWIGVIGHHFITRARLSPPFSKPH